MAWYITPDDYLQAESNNISARTLNYRVRELAWPISKATTVSPKRYNRFLDWAEKAKENGICANTFYRRTSQYGWDMERAATQPIMSRKEQAEYARSKNKVYSAETVELAQSNGISYATFRARVNTLKWSVEDASTRPVMTGRAIGLMNKAKCQPIVMARKMREKVGVN